MKVVKLFNALRSVLIMHYVIMRVKHFFKGGQNGRRKRELRMVVV